ncbi:MAG: 6-bladed beta-propeller [Gemmatimonadota bacterium]
MTSDPELAIGGIECPESCEFQRVEMAARLPDGGIVVFDRGRREARFFDEEGRHLRSMGGQGAGPGEFRQFDEVVIAPERLAVHDRGNGRITVLSLDGELERIHDVRDHPAFSGTAELVGLLGEDGAVVAQRRHLQTPGTPGYTYVRDTVVVLEAALGGGRVDTLEVVPGNEGLRWSVAGPTGGTFTTVPLPFAHTVDFASAQGRLVIARSDANGVHVIDIRGETRTILRDPDSSPRELASDRRRSHIAERVAQAEARGEEDLATVRRDAEEQLDMIPSGHVVPVRDRVMTDSEGGVWMREYEPPGSAIARRWIVFSPQGEARATVEVPEGFQIMHIGPEEVTGVVRDSLGVETVEIRRLDKQ